jgi:hypothetical protein
MAVILLSSDVGRRLSVLIRLVRDFREEGALRPQPGFNQSNFNQPPWLNNKTVDEKKEKFGEPRPDPILKIDVLR